MTRQTHIAVQLVVVQYDCNESVDVSKVRCVGHLQWGEINR